MRLTLHLTPNTEPVPFNYLGPLTGALHKWLGASNPWHSTTSLYGHSFLEGARPRQKHLSFPGGARWTIGAYDDRMRDALLDGILRNGKVAFGMFVGEVQEVATPRFGVLARFGINGAVVARTPRPDGGQQHLTYQDPEAGAALTRVLRHKLEAAGFFGDHLHAEVAFDTSYARARTRLLRLHDIAYKGSECPVIVRGTPEAVAFAWTVGVGDLTGCGFGALR